MENAGQRNFYKAGGSLPKDFPAYVVRSADEALYQNLKHGEFCYVLTPRQMGKSSLRVRAMDRLEKEGFVCCAVDITSIGSHNTTVNQWYYSFMYQIDKFLKLDSDLRAWWKMHDELTPTSKMQLFWEEKLLKKIDKPVIIFLDEIDSVLSLDRARFSTDDFFAALRAIYNLRPSSPIFERLNFAVFGVARPDDLMHDPERTPFNVGVSIPLENFSLEDSNVFSPGLMHLTNRPLEVVKWIIHWTNGQPYLTQRLCLSLSHGGRIEDPEQSVFEHASKLFLKPELLNNDSNLSSVQRRILDNKKYNSQMLDIYARLRRGEGVEVDNRKPAHLYLKLTGLVREENNALHISNKIYETVFDNKWIWNGFQQMERPFSRDLKRWLESDKSQDALLKGQFLLRALDWSQNRTDLTRDESEYLKESEIALREEKQITKRRRDLKRYSYLISGLFLLVLGLAIAIGSKNDDLLEGKLVLERQKDSIAEQKVRLETLNESLESQIDSTLKAEQEALEQADSASVARIKAETEARRAEFEKMRALEAEKEAAELTQITQSNLVLLAAQEISDDNPTLALQLLQHAADSIIETTEIREAIDRIFTTEKVFRIIASDIDPVLDLFPLSAPGELISVQKGYKRGAIISSIFHHTPSGKQRRVFSLNKEIVSAALSPDGQRLLLGAKDHTATLLHLSTQDTVSLLHGADVVSTAFSPKGSYYATGDLSNTLRVWDSESNSCIFTGKGPLGDITAIAFSPDEKYIAAGSTDNRVYLWNWASSEEIEPKVLLEHADDVIDVVFTDSSFMEIASVGRDNVTRRWNENLSESHSLGGIEEENIYHVNHTIYDDRARFSSDGKYLALATKENDLVLWDLEKDALGELKRFKRNYTSFIFSQDEMHFMAFSTDNIVTSWYLGKNRGVFGVQSPYISNLEEICASLSPNEKLNLKFANPELKGLIPEVCQNGEKIAAEEK